MLHIAPEHLTIIHGILQNYPYTFYAFGSRVKGNPKRLPDLDLCYKEEIPSYQVIESKFSSTFSLEKS